MLRTVAVLLMILAGSAAALRGPFLTLLFYLWIAYFRPELWIWSGWLQNLNLSFYVGLFLIVRTLFSSERLRWNGAGVAFSLIGGHAILSVLASPYRTQIVGPAENFIKSLVVSFLIANLVNTTARLRWALVTIALSLGLDGAKQGWVFLVTSPGAQNDNWVAFLGDNNLVAVGILMLVPLQLALAETSKSKSEKRFWIFLAMGCVYRALTTYSRGAFLTTAVLALVYLARSKSHRVLKTVGVAAAAAILLMSMPDTFWNRMDTITADTSQMDTSSAGRLHFWRVGLDMANANPIFGVGNSAYNLAYDRYDFLGGHFGQGRSVHSSWFGLLAEQGWLGFLLVLSSILGCLVAVRRSTGKLSAQDDGRAYSRAIQNGLLLFAVGGAFVPMHYNEMLWHFVGLMFAVRHLVPAEAAQAHSVPQVGLGGLLSQPPLRAAPASQNNAR